MATTITPATGRCMQNMSSLLILLLIASRSVMGPESCLVTWLTSCKSVVNLRRSGPALGTIEGAQSHDLWAF